MHFMAQRHFYAVLSGRCDYALAQLRVSEDRYEPSGKRLILAADDDIDRLHCVANAVLILGGLAVGVPFGAECHNALFRDQVLQLIARQMIDPV